MTEILSSSTNTKEILTILFFLFKSKSLRRISLRQLSRSKCKNYLLKIYSWYSNFLNTV